MINDILVSVFGVMAKIPSHATKVFSGVIFDVYQWEQELFNWNTATFEALRRPSTVIVIPVVWDRIAIARERQPGKDWYLTPFAGRMDTNEEPLTAAQRELREESGLFSDDWELYQTFSVWGKVDYKMYYFLARDCRLIAEQQLDDGGEEIEVQYLSFEDFIAFIQSEDCRDVEFANFIFRMEKEGRLDDFRKILFSK
jgi:ADP-ribose pyrophosphatase